MIDEKQDSIFRGVIEESWPDYHVEGLIGSGGFGAVYRLKKNKGIGKDRAVKIVCSRNDESLDRKIRNEIQLQYDYEDVTEIVNILDNKEKLEDGTNYHLIELELMDGSAADILREKGHLEAKEAVNIIISVCRALKTMESHDGTRAVHGDIKPANILYKDRNHDGKRIYKLSDFGCVYDVDATQSAWAGTEKYTIPSDWSETRDEYAMGISLMELMGAGIPATMDKILSKTLWAELPEKISIPEKLIEICRKAAATDPASRYQTAGEMEADLKEWLKETEAAERAREKALAQVKEILGKITGNGKAATGQDELSPETVKTMLEKAEEILRTISEGATEEEQKEIEELSGEIVKQKERYLHFHTYTEAGKLSASGDIYMELEAIRMYAEIHDYLDSAEKIRESADNVETDVKNIVTENAQCRSEIASYKSENERYRSEVENMSAEHKKTVAEYEGKIENLTSANRKQKEELESLKKSLNHKDAEITRLKEYEKTVLENRRKEEAERALLKKREEEEARKREEERRKAAQLRPGQTIEFGHYHQNADGKDNTPVRWKVLATEGKRALILSEKALEAKAYNCVDVNVTWETCDLRKWLNGEYLDKAFTAEEKKRIIMSSISNKDNPKYGTKGGNTTTDKIFLLSNEEVEKYIKTNAERKCEATEYAKKHGAYVAENGNNWWWLRSVGALGCNALFVSYVGGASLLGSQVDLENVGVRPALWISL